MKISKTANQTPISTSSENDPLKNSLSEQVQAASSQRKILFQYVEQIREHRSNWISRLLTSREEKQMLHTFWKKQEQALEGILEDRNAGLKLIGETQLAFIREVCESSLISTHSQVQLASSTAFQKRFLHLNEELEALNTSFFILVEHKMEMIEIAKDQLKELHIRQINRMLCQWEETYTRLLDDFAAIIQQRRLLHPKGIA